MRIAFYAPFKPLDHPTPSGDQVIARGLVDTLVKQGHDITVASRLRCRWIFKSPSKMVEALNEQRRLITLYRMNPVDLWLTYHCYYKSPDLLGPAVTRSLGIPYVICQGSYATKFRKKLITAPGYLLNRQALTQADLVITDRTRDTVNLKRTVKSGKMHILCPGIEPEKFSFDQKARNELRAAWSIGEEPVILTAAMFRSDVKSRGIAWVIKSCIDLYRQNIPFRLVIAGDGPERSTLEQIASHLPESTVIFTGRVERDQMYRLYSAADLFAFPGFNESLGMVYLEAQSCGLPVVACENGGVPEVVEAGRSGLLAPVDDRQIFTAHIKNLLKSDQRRRTMGSYGAMRIRRQFDKDRNHLHVGGLLQKLAQSYQQQPAEHI